MSRFEGRWLNIETVNSRAYVCGHCGSDIASDKAFTAMMPSGVQAPVIYVCHSCNKPSYVYGEEQTPGPAFGAPVKSLPADIDSLYEEIRKAASAGAYTSAVLSGRKLLMHIAVEKGAPTGKTFVQYVAYLKDNHYSPPNSDAWVDQVRQLGNEANHEIVIMGPSEAQLILTFLEMLLKFMYEFAAASAPAPEVEV